jgi:hypothetical protein
MSKREQWEIVAAYRAMVEPATDYVLRAFGMVMCGEGDVQSGYPSKSAGFLCGGLSSFEDLEADVEAQVGAVAAAIIYHGLSEWARRPLVLIYSAGRGCPTEVEFLDAVGCFELKARSRGLL